MKKFILYLALIGILLSSMTLAPVSFAEDPAVETNLNEAVYNGFNRYVTVGDQGTLMTSIDQGNTWLGVGTGVTNEDLNAVEWNGMWYVAVGNNGAILRSSDGMAWLVVTSPTDEDIFGIEWNGFLFVAVGNHGTILTSPDGGTWMVRASDTEVVLNDVVWNGGMFVAVGSNGTIMTSYDGISWSTVSLEGLVIGSLTAQEHTFMGIAWNGGVFSVVGSNGCALTSPDGFNWSGISLNDQMDLNDVVWGGNIFVAAGTDGKSFSSYDGVEWQPSEVLYEYSNLNAVIWDNEAFMAFGWFKLIQKAVPPPPGGFSAGERLFTPQVILPPPIIWNRIWPIPSVPYYYWCHLNDVEWSPQLRLFVTVGTWGRLLTSPDGFNWTVRYSGTSRQLNGVAWSPALNLFMAVGDYGTVITSSNGINWSSMPRPTGLAILNVAWDGFNSRFIATGNFGFAGVYSNTTGWYVVPRFTWAHLYDVIYDGAGLDVAAGQWGRVYSVANPYGIWTRETTNTTVQFNDVAYGAPMNPYVIVGPWPGIIYYRLAGTATWTQCMPPPTFNRFFMGVTWKYTNNPTVDRYVAVGSWGRILNSPNGISWNGVGSPTSRLLNDVTWSPNLNLFVAIGTYERIITSPNGVNWTIRR